MKKYLCMLALLGITCVGVAQCDKKYRMTSERLHQIASDGSEGDEIPLNANITLSKDSIFIVINNQDGSNISYKGLHKETVCKMNADYSEGSIEYKTDAELGSNDVVVSKKAKWLFKLESKGGKLKLYAAPEYHRDGKFCLVIGNKEEVK